MNEMTNEIKGIERAACAMLFEAISGGLHDADALAHIERVIGDATHAEFSRAPLMDEINTTTWRRECYAHEAIGKAAASFAATQDAEALLLADAVVNHRRAADGNNASPISLADATAYYHQRMMNAWAKRMQQEAVR